MESRSTAAIRSERPIRSIHAQRHLNAHILSTNLEQYRSLLHLYSAVQDALTLDGFKDEKACSLSL